MTKIPFSQMNLTPKVERAIAEMGFDFATQVQSEAIPLIRTGVDVIARSQTGTGKTVAFAIPAIERVDTHEEKPTIQVLILCPTRELAQQAADEIRKVARFKTGIRPVEIYGGAAIDKQCIHLRRANIVVGTPGRVMDHMRRKTIKLSKLKMIILDEADEMLNMGFKEDIETILTDTPADRQTVMFSATMPPAILKLTEQFQKNPQMIEINKDQVTIEDIEQSYIDVPHHRKKDALAALLDLHEPKRAIIFCNTKMMVDELTELLAGMNMSVQSIHSDIKQSQRTAVMQGFKQGRTSILIATDIAARGIDVSDVDFVINYDIPANTEFYIHRIGRTGRAGKSGRTITFCSGRREVSAMRVIAREAKSEIKQMELPTSDEMKKLNSERMAAAMREVLSSAPQPLYTGLADQLAELGYSPRDIAAAALQLHFAAEVSAAAIPVPEHRPEPDFHSKSRPGESRPAYGHKDLSGRTVKYPGKAYKHS
jgi:ATP-dependent RNA helicase DeaD